MKALSLYNDHFLDRIQVYHEFILKEEIMMPDSTERLNKVAEEIREERPFAKLDKMEKELNLDESPDVDLEDAEVNPEHPKKKVFLDEEAIIELTATQQQAKFNNQPPR